MAAKKDVREALAKDYPEDEYGVDFTDVSQIETVNLYVTEYHWDRVIEDLAVLRAAGEAEALGLSYDELNGSVEKTRLLTDLATYFKYGSYGYKLGGDGSVVGVSLVADEISIQNMLMYAILVVQSMILFIAYIKRLFYVIILALMAPAVVVVDFFTKFGK